MASSEGWFVDAYGFHEARWFSDGTPTALVRDGDVEALDPPPDIPITEPLEPWGRDESAAGPGIRRVDDVEREYDPKAFARAAFDEFDRTPPWNM